MTGTRGRAILSRRGLRRGLRLASLLIAAWLVVSLGAAYKLTRRPHARFEEPAPTVPWGEFESLRLRTRDGQTLGAWFLPGRKEAPSVMLLHGNGGSRRSNLRLAEVLAPRGYSVLMISMRAHGDSTGTFNDFGYGARHDVVAATEFLERRRPGGRIVIHGVSLGSAAAAFAAEELGERVHGYVLECPYRDLKTAVRNRTRAYLPPIFEWVAYHSLLAVSPAVLRELDRISPVDAIGGVPEATPVLILAGRADWKALPEEAEALLARVRSHGRLVVFDGAAHVRLHVADPGRYREEIGRFLETIGPALAGPPDTAMQTR
jgi:uncharacterized protein